jgi:hypothetical protein
MKWVDVNGYEGVYEVSETGLVRSKERIIVNKTKTGGDRPCKLKSKTLKPFKRKDGRFEVVLSVKGKTKTTSVHVLVARNFLNTEVEGLEVNHIDGNHTNNHYSNLEWVTKKENIRHSFFNEIMPTCKKVALLDANGHIEKVFPSESQACRSMGVAQGKIGRAIKRNGKSVGRKFIYVDESVTTTEKWTSPT